MDPPLGENNNRFIQLTPVGDLISANICNVSPGFAFILLIFTFEIDSVGVDEPVTAIFGPAATITVNSLVCIPTDVVQTPETPVTGILNANLHVPDCSDPETRVKYVENPVDPPLGGVRIRLIQFTPEGALTSTLICNVSPAFAVEELDWMLVSESAALATGDKINSGEILKTNTISGRALSHRSENIGPCTV